MSGAPNPNPPVTHRKRHASAWQTTPRSVKITAGVCLVLLAASLFVLEKRLFKPPPPASALPLPSAGKAFDKIAAGVKQFDLVLSECSLNLATRRIEGMVTNQSGRGYSDIQVFFYLPSPDMMKAETIAVVIAHLEPHASARFASGPISPQVKEWSMKEIKGTPTRAESRYTEQREAK